MSPTNGFHLQLVLTTMSSVKSGMSRIPIIGGLVAAVGTIGAIIVVLLAGLVLFLLAPIALLWSLNELGLTDVDLLNLWNILAALIIILVLRGKIGYS